MNRSNRKSKLSKYTVTIKREIEHVAVIEDVEARSAEEAEDIAKNIAEEPHVYWSEGDVISETVKAKLLRNPK